MGNAERTDGRFAAAERAMPGGAARGVPVDWFVDPADEAAAERYRDSMATTLEDQATAYLAAHAPEVDEAPHPGGLEATTVPQAVWIGLPGFPGAEDEGELGWQTEALCAQTDPEAFFPEKGGSTRDAKKVCGACNVRSECLEYALSNDERFGIWGGLSERERRRLRKRAV